MLVKGRDWMLMFNALEKYIEGSHYSGLDVNWSLPRNYLTFLLNICVLDVLHNIDKHLDGILNYIKNEDDRENVKNVLLYLSKNIDLTAGLFNNPPDEFKRFLETYVLNTGDLSTRDYYRYVAKYIPVYGVSFSPVEEYNVILYPTEDELNSLQIIKNALDDILEFLVEKFVKIDVARGIVEIIDKKYVVPLDGLVDIASRISMPDDLKREIFTEMVNVLKPELSKFGTVETHGFTLVLKLDNVVKKVKKEYRMEIEDFRLIIPFGKRFGKFFIDGELDVKVGNGKIHVDLDDIPVYSSTLCRVEKCRYLNSDLSSSTASQLSDIPQAVENKILTSLEFTSILYRIVKPLIETGRKHGFEFPSPSNMREIEVKKPSKDGKTESIVELNLTIYDRPVILGKVFAFYTSELRDDGYILYYRLKNDLSGYSVLKFEDTVVVERKFEYIPDMNFKTVFEEVEKTHKLVNNLYHKIYGTNKKNIH